MDTKINLDYLETSSMHDDPQNQGVETNIAPIIWRRLAVGIKIIDLLPIHFDAVVDIILKFYVTENVLFKNTNFLNDAESIESYKEKLLDCMKDRCSIIGVKEENDEIVAILLLKAVKKIDCARTYSYVDINSGKTYSSILKFMNAMKSRVDIYEQFKCKMYLRFYLLCVIPECRKKRIGFQMMICIMDMAQYHEISVIMGIMDSHKLQDNCRRLGFITLCETTYRKYHDEDKLLIFRDCGAGNYTCALMACIVRLNPDPVSMKKVAIKDSEKKKKGGKGKKK